MTSGNDHRVFDELLDQMADERLTDEQAAELESQVTSDAALRQRYIAMSVLCAQLEWLGEARPAGPIKFGSRQRQSNGVLGALAARNRWAVFAGAVATAALLLAGAWALWWPGDLDRASPFVAAPGEPDGRGVTEGPDVVATLTGIVDCQWAADGDGPSYGQQLHAGQVLRLRSGLAQLTFESGTKLILQGPAEFALQSEMEATLDVGKLAALVPQQARGFTVDTPAAEVVDLGTEFGVDVDESGRTEVHVFDGEVVSWQVDSAGEVGEDAMSLTTSQAAVYHRGGLPQQMAADPGKFAREVAPRIARDDLPALPVDRGLALWLAADVLVKKDNDDRVIAWRDILVGDNQLEEDALQHFEEARPLWVDNAVGGNPAVRFDGEVTFLVTTPLLTTPEQTVFVAFAHRGRPANSRGKHQIINYNGPPYDLAATESQFRILQFDDFDEPGLYRALVYAGIGGRLTHFGFTSMVRPVPPGEPIVLAYIYDPSTSHAELWANGASQGVGTASPGFEFASRKIIGKHPKERSYFQGDIAELLIYNAALSNDEVDDINYYLAEKYLAPSAE